MAKKFMPGRNINPETGKRMPGYKPRLPVEPKPIKDTFNVRPDEEFTEGNRDTWGALAGYLNSIGLGSLLTIDASGNPTGWLYDAVVDGVETVGELMIRLQDTPEFQNRFGVIIEQQKRVAAGEDVYVMTPEDVINYENAVKQAFTRSGMPEWFMGNRDQIDELILSGISYQDVVDKIDVAFDYAQSAPPEVLDAFKEFYGAKSQEALAAFVLDPDLTMANLERAQRTAYAAGIGERFDVSISRQAAERIATLPMTEEGIATGMENIARQAGLFTESFGERRDLTAEQTGVAVEFGGDAAAATEIERRMAQRQTIGRGSAGGALLTQEGVVGL